MTFFFQKTFFDNQDARSDYVVSFVDMARKGFVSMDRSNIFDITDQNYHVVCMPPDATLVEGVTDIVKIKSNVELHASLCDFDLLNYFPKLF